MYVSTRDLGRIQLLQLREFLLETGDVRVALGRLAGLGFMVQPLPHQSFGLTDGEASCDKVSRPFDLPFQGQTEVVSLGLSRAGSTASAGK